MTQFEEITQSPETLAAFLSSLPVIDGPWDKEFQARFCAGCAAENCDDCPNQRFRNNPGWWLNQTAAAEQPGACVIDLDRAEAEQDLTPEERAEMERLRPMFRYFISDTGSRRMIITARNRRTPHRIYQS